MKFIFCAVSALTLSLSAFSQEQLNNGGFESWTLYKPAYTFYAPDEWTDGSSCATVGNNPEQCSFRQGRTTDAHSGSYAVMLFDSQGSSSVNYSTLSSYANSKAPAFTGRPTSVSYYYKYITDDNQPVKTEVLLFTGSVFSPTLIGSGAYTTSTSVDQYTKVTFEITYASSSAPTNILFKSSFTPKPTTPNDTIKLDDIVFNYSITEVGVEFATNFTARIIGDKLVCSQALAQLSILDLSGKVVAAYSGLENSFNISNLESGIYILQGFNDNAVVSKKIVIQ